jgi:diguanylate cyclase (GGDEF)-like protein/PAS domain S-box-containing protein
MTPRLNITQGRFMVCCNQSKVLIVDDLEANRYALELILAPLNVAVFHASSGEGALVQVLNHDFAIILMDVKMPHLDGYETVKLIHGHKKFKNIPIVMVTASHQNRRSLRQAYEAGAVDYVIKPIEPMVIMAKVRQFVELDRLHRSEKQAKIDAQESQLRYQALLNSAGEGVLGIDLNGVITFANPKACQILEAEHDDLMLCNLQKFFVSQFHEELLGEPDSSLSAGINKSKLWSMINQGKGGCPFGERWVTSRGNQFYVEFTSDIAIDKHGATIGGVVMFQNITQRKESEQKLHYLANYDSLTDLANRAFFNDHLAKLIVRSQRLQTSLAVLFIDLDHFKCVNDRYGHDIGDILLQYVSAMLRGSVRECDLIARIGGDEFAIVLADIENANDIAKVANKILAKVEQPIDIQGLKLTVSVSIGIGHYEDATMTMEELIKAADTAMYSAKLQGRNNYQFFEKSMYEKVKEKQNIKMMLQQAISNQELFLVYQPQVSLSKKRFVGCEALLRWRTKEGEMITPDKFIPIAEESGQIEVIGDWVLNAVCQQIVRWRQQVNIEQFTVSINVSVRQLTDSKFSEKIIFLLKKYDIDPQQIEIEITETAMTSNYEKLVEELHKIHQLGVVISIDDFGTGHASLDNLRKLPLDKLKIDRSFIQDIGLAERDENITKVIISIAKKLSLALVAEGVETVEQLAFLANEDCDVIQGYYFSKPISAEQILNYLLLNEHVFDQAFSQYNHYLKGEEKNVALCLLPIG